MVKFEDFSGIKKGHFFNTPDQKQAMIEMNKWIDNDKVKIVSVETIMKGENVYFDFFRVWYIDVEVRN